MTESAVTCIVPVFNGERFLTEALQSILDQTRPPEEIIVVDDGSTDGSRAVAESFGSSVRYVHQENAGPAVARNTGIDEARGEFIAFLDADDRWDPRKLELQLRRLEERPELAFCVAMVQNFWEEEVADEAHRLQDHVRARPIPGYVTGTLLVRREWVDRVGGFDPGLSHGDATDWFSRAEAAGAVGDLLQDVLLFRRLHAENRSRVKAAGSRDEFLRLLKSRLDRRRQPQGPYRPQHDDTASSPGGVVAPLAFRHPPAPGLVSCIVPVFNGEKYVGEAIESILRQTYPDVEVTVVDDGSTDGTPEVLASFGARIQVHRQENQGPSLARNLGLEESRGAFVAFLDADDIWVDDKIESQLARFQASPDLELCSGHIKSFWIPELEHERAQLEDHPYHREKPMFSPCTILARRELFARVGGFDPSLRNGEDTDWFIRMMRSGTRYDTLPRLLVHRRQHTSNLTRKVKPSHDRMLELLKRSLDRNRS